MTVTAPPRPPRRSDPVRHDEFEALVEALIEEARQRTRRRRQRYAGSALLALLVALAAYVGFARGGSDAATSLLPAARPAQGGQEPRLKFRLLSITTSTRFTGKKLYVRHELRNGFRGQFGRPQNAVVGSDAWVVTRLPPVERRVGNAFVVTPGGALVRANVRLPGGTLRLQGRVPGTSFVPQTGGSVPVVGGTGRYAKARGTIRVRWRPTIADWNDYTLRLR